MDRLTPAHGQGRASVQGSPCSSVGSHTLLSCVGHDLNQTHDIVCYMEGRLGRDVEFEELSAQIRSFTEKNGHIPTLGQLMLALSVSDADCFTSRNVGYVSYASPKELPPRQPHHAVPWSTAATPAPRPLVPGLNLRGVKQRSPAVLGSPIPTASQVCTEGIPANDGPGDAKPAPQTPESASPTNILKMLIPTACKRPFTRVGLRLRGYELSTPTAAHTEAEPEAVDPLEDMAAKPRLAPIRLGCSRFSMDLSTQQEQPGPLHPIILSPSMKYLSPVRGTTPGALHALPAPVVTGAAKPFAAKRQLRLESEVDGGTDVDGDDDLAARPLDSNKRLDTPSKSGALRWSIDPFKQNEQLHSDVAYSNSRSEDQQLDGRGVRVSPARDPLDRPRPRVPPLSLPPHQTAGRPFGLPRPSVRQTSGAIEYCNDAARSSGHVASLEVPVAIQQQGRGRDGQGGMPTGARTRRLSVCLPSSMLGPQTTRLIATGATTGVTSHALCTVFWAESEDELEDEGSECDSEEEWALEEEAQRELLARSLIPDAQSVLHAATPASGGSGTGLSHFGPAISENDNQSRPRPRRGRRSAMRGAVGHDDAKPDSGGLLLPEELWTVWERLSDGNKGRQYSLLESLTHVERITCTSYSTVSKASYQGQQVVVKIYDVAEREKLANAFAEIGVLLHLSGWPGAVKLIDYGRIDDRVMLMLESCDRSLKDWCDNRRFEDGVVGSEFTLQCLRMWCNLLELLAELHDRFHVAHCDLKPGNVLLLGGRLRLADFSESMLFHETPMLCEQARGTVAYQPPEMFYGHLVDARKADVWAMGCILYEMVTGELLFKGNNDAMRAVAPGGCAAARQLHQLEHYTRSRLGTLRSEEKRGSHGARRRGARTAQGPQQQHRYSCSGLASGALHHGPEQPSAAAGQAPGSAAGASSYPLLALAVLSAEDATAVQAPRVPKLALGMTRPPAVCPAVWRCHPPDVHPHVPAVPLLALPPHMLLSSRSAYAGMTGRSLELIAEASGTEDASSMASDPWVTASALNTAPTTARSTARSHVRIDHTRMDTARSVASASTTAAAWPPPPPPSTGTARSVAESEWTLALPATTRVDATHAADGIAAEKGTEGGDGELSCVSTGGAICGAGSAPGGLSMEGLPPHLRLRHSVATQCADPAGPDWLATEEADRLRIMVDEAPSFVLVQQQGSECGGYEPRSLSGANGPSLCDDVLGLLRVVLVEDHARPTMSQLARMATAVLQRHTVPGSPPLDLAAEQSRILHPSHQSCPDDSVLILQAHTAGARIADAAEDLWTQGGTRGIMLQLAGDQGALRQETYGESPLCSPGSRQNEPGPLNLASLQQALPQFASGAQCSAAAPPARVQNMGTDGDSWTDRSSFGGAHASGDVVGAAAMEAANTSGPVLNLFDVCQPLVTSRGSRTYSRSWQRFLWKT